MPFLSPGCTFALGGVFFFTSFPWHLYPGRVCSYIFLKILRPSGIFEGMYFVESFSSYPYSCFISSSYPYPCFISLNLVFHIFFLSLSLLHFFKSCGFFFCFLKSRVSCHRCDARMKLRYELFVAQALKINYVIEQKPITISRQ